MASGTVPAEGEIVLTCVLMDATGPLTPVDVNLTVDHEQRNVGEEITRVDQDVVRFVQENGEEFREQITDFSSVDVLGGQYTIYSGRFTTADGDVLDFVSSVDFEPMTTTAMVLFGAVCIVGIGLVPLIDLAFSALSGDAEKCREAGGRFIHEPEFKAEIKLLPPKVACYMRVPHRCLGADGQVLESDEGQFQLLHEH
jgi:hypothetical protein